MIAGQRTGVAGQAMLRRLPREPGTLLRLIPQEPRARFLLATLLASGLLLAGIGTFLVLDGEPEPLPPQNPVELSATGEVAASSRPATPTTLPPGLPTAGAGLGIGEDDLIDIADRTSPSAYRPLDIGCEEPVTVAAPGGDLASVVASSEPGTCFVLEPGEYRFHNVVPKDYMTFLGSGRTSTIVRGDGSTENAFHGTATGVTIGRMTLTGFRGDGGTKAQEQGAIRGTSALWASDRGQMATQWLIQDVEASNNLATGIFLGDHFTIRNSTITNNGISGLGGSELVGGLIEGNVVSGNGEEGATGVYANGGGMKFTQAGTLDEPVVVRGNEIHGNSGIGVWCDIGCQGFEVIGNYIHDQTSRAFMYELSSHAIVSGNLMVDANSWSDFSRDFNAGAITIGESSDVVVEGNYIDGAVAGIIVRQTQRPVRPQENFLDGYEGVTYLSERIEITGNVIVNTEAMGISVGATGRGLLPDPSTIVFQGNIYGSPGRMAFWWANGERYDHASWQSSGRDTGGGSVPPRPDWPLSP